MWWAAGCVPDERECKIIPVLLEYFHFLIWFGLKHKEQFQNLTRVLWQLLQWTIPSACLTPSSLPASAQYLSLSTCFSCVLLLEIHIPVWYCIYPVAQNLKNTLGAAWTFQSGESTYIHLEVLLCICPHFRRCNLFSKNNCSQSGKVCASGA